MNKIDYKKYCLDGNEPKVGAMFIYDSIYGGCSGTIKEILPSSTRYGRFLSNNNVMYSYNEVTISYRNLIIDELLNSD